MFVEYVVRSYVADVVIIWFVVVLVWMIFSNCELMAIINFLHCIRMK